MREIKNIVDGLAKSIALAAPVDSGLWVHARDFMASLMYQEDDNSVGNRVFTNNVNDRDLLYVSFLCQIINRRDCIFYLENNSVHKYKLNCEVLEFELLEEELLPCIYCGDAVQTDALGRLEEVCVMCVGDHCEFQSGYFKTDELAVKDYNEMYRKLKC